MSVTVVVFVTSCKLNTGVLYVENRKKKSYFRVFLEGLFSLSATNKYC